LEMGDPPRKVKKIKYIAGVDGLDFSLEVIDDHHVRFGDEILEVDLAAVSGQPLYSLVVNHESYEGYVYPDEDTWQVHLLGQLFEVRVEDEREAHLRLSSQSISSKDIEFILKAPMPGLVIDVQVKENQPVERGQSLIILESMKMQNELRAPFSGKVTGLKIKTGETVQQKQTLLVVTSIGKTKE
jgi:biotin carboxyl carrier protein